MRLPTVVHSPFMLQAQAIAPDGLSRSSSMPIGNGLPMKKEMGKIMAAATAMRTACGAAIRSRAIGSCHAQMASPQSITPANGTGHRDESSPPTLDELMLPNAAPISITVMTVATEYSG